jgi:hypothetical protein
LSNSNSPLFLQVWRGHRYDGVGMEMGWGKRRNRGRKRLSAAGANEALMYSAETLLKATLYLIFFGCEQDHMVTDVSMMTVDYILLAQHM